MEGLYTTHHHSLYIQALQDPSQMEESDIQQLVVRYPYSQPLRFALARKKNLAGSGESPSLAVLFAPSANWLFDYVHKAVDRSKDATSTEQYVNFVEVEAERYVVDLDDTTEENDTEEEFFTDEGLANKSAETKLEEDEQFTLEKLIRGGAVSGEYLVYQEMQAASEADPEEELVEIKEEENISLYNDELMPYSFRWWLHKTRLEHADTYQPFAHAELPKPKKGHLDMGRLSDAMLDQQIKENIFHLQDPEVKLSEETLRKTIPFNPSTKVDEVIEKFIRDEPIIHPPSSQQLNTENKARQSAEDNYTLVTETLANIYADQNLFLKAIEVFHKLILKYPEKKSYFANRIKELEKNI